MSKAGSEDRILQKNIPGWRIFWFFSTLRKRFFRIYHREKILEICHLPHEHLPPKETASSLLPHVEEVRWSTPLSVRSERGVAKRPPEATNVRGKTMAGKI